MSSYTAISNQIEDMEAQDGRGHPQTFFQERVGKVHIVPTLSGLGNETLSLQNNVKKKKNSHDHNAILDSCHEWVKDCSDSH